MPEGGAGPEGDLAAARDLVAAALTSLEASRERIDNLNVYPVPDGDTGTNMVLTVRAVRDALAAVRLESREDVARTATRACLMAARGNSGVILSQLVRGAADTLARTDRVDVGSVARTLRAASDAGYAAVREPQEGTILTVARAMAERAEEAAARGPSLGEALAEVEAAGAEALARTPEQLATLADAGVVDAGGAGLLELVRGIAAYVRGEPLPEAPAAAAPLPLEAVHRELSRFRYCTSFFVEGPDADPDGIEQELRAFGDSVLVVGTRGTVKAHVHTDDPGRALSLATRLGVVEEVDVKDMHAQTAERTERLAAAAVHAATSAVAVSVGAGNERLFRELGAADVVAGGQTMNPATSALVDAIEAAPAAEVIVLPNNRNVLLSAEQAAEQAGKPALVVPTETIQAGLAAMVAFDPARSAPENAGEMRAAAAEVRTGAVTRASCTTSVGGLAVEEGDFLGLVDGDVVAWGQVLDAVARDVLERLLASDAALLTMLLGEEAPDVDGLRGELAAAHPGLEIAVEEGGQPHYPLLLAVE